MEGKGSKWMSKKILDVSNCYDEIKQISVWRVIWGFFRLVVKGRLDESRFLREIK